MAEHEELERRLALAREVYVAPADLRERVLARLLPAPAASGDIAPAPSPTATGQGWFGRSWLRRGGLARGLPPGPVALLVGLGFGAGFWLGQLRAEAGVAAASPVASDPAPSSAVSSGLASSGPASSGPASSGPVDPPSVFAAAAEAANGGGERVDGEAQSTAEAPGSVVALAPMATPRATRPTPRSTKLSSVPRGSKPESSKPSSGASDATLALEIALLARVERALRAGEPRLALSLLDELERAVPVPALSHERAAAHVLARCIRSATHEPTSSEEQLARSGAERFLRAHAASVYAERIRSACALEHVEPTAPSKKRSALDTQQGKEVR